MGSMRCSPQCRYRPACRSRPSASTTRRTRRTSRSASSRADLEQSNLPPDRLDQLARVVSNSLSKNQRDMSDVGDGGRGIAVDHNEVGLLAHRKRPDAIRSTEVGRPVQGADLDRLERCQAALDEQLYLPLIGVAG